MTISVSFLCFSYRYSLVHMNSELHQINELIVTPKFEIQTFVVIFMLQRHRYLEQAYIYANLELP